MAESDPSSPPAAQSLPWRTQSSFVMGIVGGLCRGFLYGLNDFEVFGLDGFLKTLDRRRDVEGRTRGLITGTFTKEGPPNLTDCCAV